MNGSIRSRLSSKLYSHLSTLLTPTIANSISLHGYAVVENSVPEGLARDLVKEIESLYNNGYMSPNHTAYVESKSINSISTTEEDYTNNLTIPIDRTITKSPTITQLLVKPNIFESEMVTDLEPVCPHLAFFFHFGLPLLESKFSNYFPHLCLYPGDSTMKMQYNTGNGSFPFHYDSPGGNLDTRRLTCLFYLNEYWIDDDGGELVLQPFLQGQVKILPIWRRLVIFKSDTLLHRVNNNNRNRICLTIWLHGRGGEENWIEREQQQQQLQPLSQTNIANVNDISNNPDDHSIINIDDFTSHWFSLLNSPSHQRVLSRVIYATTWKQSYRSAHTVHKGNWKQIKENQNSNWYQNIHNLDTNQIKKNVNKPNRLNSELVVEEEDIIEDLGASKLINSLNQDIDRLMKNQKMVGIINILLDIAKEMEKKPIFIGQIKPQLTKEALEYNVHLNQKKSSIQLLEREIAIPPPCQESLNFLDFL